MRENYGRICVIGVSVSSCSSPPGGRVGARSHGSAFPSEKLHVHPDPTPVNLWVGFGSVSL